MWNPITKTLFHLLPLWPLIMGYYYFFIACVLFVLTFYIKVMKLDQTIAQSGDPDGELAATRDFWKRPTFLR